MSHCVCTGPLPPRQVGFRFIAARCQSRPAACFMAFYYIVYICVPHCARWLITQNQLWRAPAKRSVLSAWRFPLFPFCISSSGISTPVFSRHYRLHALFMPRVYVHPQRMYDILHPIIDDRISSRYSESGCNDNAHCHTNYFVKICLNKLVISRILRKLHLRYDLYIF